MKAIPLVRTSHIEQTPTADARGLRPVARPRLMGIVSCYLLEENESGQIKESNLVTHTTL
jgi:hypothetical protein